MASKQEILQDRYDTLEIRYTELESYYFEKFKLKSNGLRLGIITPENYYIECTRSSKEGFDMRLRQYKTALADALEALDSYESAFFSDSEYAESARALIQEISNNTDKILKQLGTFNIIFN
jgi:hypothetical protein